MPMKKYHITRNLDHSSRSLNLVFRPFCGVLLILRSANRRERL